MAEVLQERYSQSASAVRLHRVSFVDDLSTGELLTGTPTVTCTSTSMTLGNKALNTSAYTDSRTNRSVTTGKGVQFTATTASTGTYTITLSVGTNASPAQTLRYQILLEVS